MWRILALLGILAASVSASADPPSSYDRAMAPYFAELAKRCPDRHLDLLSPADLRDQLDSVKRSQPKAEQAQLDAAEKAGCAHTLAGATCANVADLKAMEGLAFHVAIRVCSSYKLCRGPSDCDRNP